MTETDAHDLLKDLTGELSNFEEIAACLLPLPGEIPRLAGVDVWGGSLSFKGVIGGDHIIYVDFKQRFDLPARIGRALAEGKADVADNLRRCERMAGIAVVDVSGHRVTDALLAAMLHQAFLVGTLYELDMVGHITKRLFEHLNTRFFASSAAHKYIAMIYGEISDDSRFRFLSAGQPLPAVFSNARNQLMEVEAVSFPPVGMLPTLDLIDRRADSPLGFKDRYEMNEWSLMGSGDILVLHTDGLAEHTRGDDFYMPSRMERCLREVKHLSAVEIFAAIREDLLSFAEPTDDISFVVIKRL